MAATSQFPGILASVSVATAGALTGDGTTGNKLAVSVDGVTVTVNGSNQLEAAGGGGTPGGSNTQVQFNDSGAFGGDAGLTYNKTTNVLAVAGAYQAADGTVGAPSVAFTSTVPTGLYLDTNDLTFGPAVGISLQGSPAPDTTATAALGATSLNTNGAHQVYQTYVTAAGETTAFLIATITVTDNKEIDLSAIQLGNTAVTNINIYMTPAGQVGAATAGFVGAIGDNETETYTIDIDDGDLGSPPPIANGTAISMLFQSAGNVVRLVPSAANSIVAIGAEALSTNGIDGTLNVAIGYRALYRNGIGAAFNVAIGALALSGTNNGADNIAIGAQSLASQNSMTDAYSNVAIGSNALESNQTGYENVAIGFSASNAPTNLHNTVTIGASAEVTDDDRIVIGNASVTDAYVGSEAAAANMHAALFIPTVGYQSVDASTGVTGDASLTDVLHFKNGIYVGKN